MQGQEVALECVGARKVFYVRKEARPKRTLSLEGAGQASRDPGGSPDGVASGGCVAAVKPEHPVPGEPERDALTNGRHRARLAVSRAIATMFPRTVKVEAVSGVTFSVKRGEIFGILGPNGSGKSTLIRLISTLLLPDEGEIRVFGHDVVRERFEVRRLINRVSVEAAFFKKLSAMENLSYAARLYDVDIGLARRKAVEILRRLGFSESKAYEPLEDLSRGMQQKVAVARALLTSPVLLLLDEPTTGLDPVSKREVQDYVLEVRNSHDTTVILTTHDMQEADRLCDRVAIIDQGRFVALDTPTRLKESLSTNGEAVTLEHVFFALTGKALKDSNPEEAD
ncbi:MAG: ABC transporter ATP-binding protein [Firmicutes bacterium]|jgi:ABC-2 type transport system ATP-binding protein|nr:ABC transporter ATP-binding protein [Bacillota bacterium]